MLLLFIFLRCSTTRSFTLFGNVLYTTLLHKGQTNTQNNALLLKKHLQSVHTYKITPQLCKFAYGFPLIIANKTQTNIQSVDNQ